MMQSTSYSGPATTTPDSVMRSAVSALRFTADLSFDGGAAVRVGDTPSVRATTQGM
jgi:hypothetical protein